MSIEAELPDGTVLEFPDGTGPDIIQRTAKNMLAKKGGEMALDGMSGFDKFFAGVGKGVTDVGRGLQQVVGLGDQAAIDEAKQRDAALSGTGAGLAGEVAGNIASTFVPGGAFGRAAQIAGKVLPRVLAPAAGAAAIGAGTAALTTPLATGESRGAAAGMGALGGAGGEALARGAARIAQPIMQSPAVKTLLDNGIVPSMGQAAGGAAKGAESKLSSIPFLGDVIKWGANRPVQEMNLAVLKTVDPAATQIGREGVQAAQNAASAAYDSALSKFQVIPDGRFSFEAKRIANDATHLLTEDQRTMFNNFVRDKIVDPLKRAPQVTGTKPAQYPILSEFGGGNLIPEKSVPIAPIASGQIAKEIDSEIGSQAVGYMKSQSQSEKNFGKALFKLQGQWRELIERNAPPDVVAEVRDANRKWANLTILERAAAKSGAENGVFTSAQLQQAVREADPTIRKRAFSAGNARGQALSDAAKTTIGGGYPDSGTAGRTLAAHALLGATGAVAGTATGYGAENGGMAGVGVPLGLAALAAPFYSRAGSRYMVGHLMPGQGALADLARSFSPYTSQAGRAYTQEHNKK